MKSFFTFLSRNKLYATIEALGLALAFGFIIILAAYARTAFSVGTRQPLSQRLYAIGTADSFGMTLGTAEEFFPSVPEIEAWTRIADNGDMDITIGDEYYAVKAAAVDTNFLQLFDYRLTGCSKDRILASADQAIISESFAHKAFAGENPVGRILTEGDRHFVVCGVIEDFGAYDVFNHCDVLLSMKVMEGTMQRMNQFGSVQTFVTLADGASPDSVALKLLDKYCAYWGDSYQRDASNGGFLYGSSLTRLDHIYFSGKETYDIIKAGDRKTVENLLLVALALLVSAIFNYINLTVAQAGKRAKEMATRRLLGESQRGILCRYIGESFVFTLACFALGCGIACCLRPLMNELLTTDIPLHGDGTAVAFALVLVGMVSLVSGLLPAMLSLRFKPIDVVKGNFRFRSKMLFSRVFIVCQNLVSTVLIALALTMVLQMRHLAHLPCGYHTDDIIELYTYTLGYPSMDAPNELAKRLRALPCVEDIGMSINPPSRCSDNGLFDEQGKMSWLSLSSLDSVSFRMLGFKVVRQYSAPLDGTCWLTEEAQKRYGITEKNRDVGRLGDGRPQYQCCGIIADYRSKDALRKPMDDSHNAVMNRNDLCASLLIKVTGDRKEASEKVADVWRKVAKTYLGVPKEPEMHYLDEFLSSSLTGDRHTMTLVCLFMWLSILISALGLFAMSICYADGQKKSIALHKIAGAETHQAVLKLSRPFVAASLTAIVLATPISLRLMQHYLEGFYNRIPFPWWVLVAAAAISFVISVLSILGQTLKAAWANPTESIKGCL